MSGALVSFLVACHERGKEFLVASKRSEDEKPRTCRDGREHGG